VYQDAMSCCLIPHWFPLPAATTSYIASCHIASVWTLIGVYSNVTVDLLVNLWTELVPWLMFYERLLYRWFAAAWITHRGCSGLWLAQPGRLPKNNNWNWSGRLVGLHI